MPKNKMEIMEVEGAKENGRNEVELTETESELYDRQIRLWGLESQKRLRTAKVLISGLSGVGAEVTKNIILSGVHSVQLNDEKIVTEEDFCSQFLLPRSSLGSNRAVASIERAKALNPMVEISADKEPLNKKKAGFFEAFDVVVIIGAGNDELVRIDNICREKRIKFFACDVWGSFGFCFADHLQHKFVEDIVKHKVISKPHEKTKTELITTTVQKKLNFPAYKEILEFDINCVTFQRKLKRTGPAFILLRILQKFRETHKRDPSYVSREEDMKELESIRNQVSPNTVIPKQYLEHVFGQISPAAAIVGGVLSQEIIKVVTEKEAPICNVFLFDPELLCGFIETIGNN